MSLKKEYPLESDMSTIPFEISRFINNSKTISSLLSYIRIFYFKSRLNTIFKLDCFKKNSKSALRISSFEACVTLNL